MVETLYSHKILAKKRNLGGILGHVSLRMRRNGQNTTSGFRFDHVIQSGMVENLCSHKILAKNTNLVGF